MHVHWLKRTFLNDKPSSSDLQHTQTHTIIFLQVLQDLSKEDAPFIMLCVVEYLKTKKQQSVKRRNWYSSLCC